MKKFEWALMVLFLYYIYPFLFSFTFDSPLLLAYYQDLGRSFFPSICHCLKNTTIFFSFLCTPHILLPRLFSSVKFQLILKERNPFLQSITHLISYNVSVSEFLQFYAFPLLLDNTQLVLFLLHAFYLKVISTANSA